MRRTPEAIGRAVDEGLGIDWALVMRILINNITYIDIRQPIYRTPINPSGCIVHVRDPEIRALRFLLRYPLGEAVPDCAPD